MRSKRDGCKAGGRRSCFHAAAARRGRQPAFAGAGEGSQKRAPVWKGERDIMVNGTRVVVTGPGAITSTVNDTRETWEAVKAGRSGIRRVQTFDPSAMPSKVASEVVDFKPEARLDRKEARRMSRFVQFAMGA